MLVKLPGSNRFVPLDQAVIRNGSEVDARAGRVEITRADGGRAIFYSGLFKLSTSGGVHRAHPHRAARLQGGQAQPGDGGEAQDPQAVG